MIYILITMSILTIGLIGVGIYLTMDIKLESLLDGVMKGARVILRMIVGGFLGWGVGLLSHFAFGGRLGIDLIYTLPWLILGAYGGVRDYGE